MVPEAMRIPHDEEIMPREEAGSPPSPVTICAALTNNDNISEGTVPLALTSDAGEEQPHNRTEATVLHYRDDSVVIVRSNGQETVLTSRPWNGDRDPTQIYTRMAVMYTEPLPCAFRYALSTNAASTLAL